ncbi:hypothetical protein SHKM778_72510 [Streptomyces sp. KM77-8]|uniref:Transketolase signature 1 domain-containing protein n=1 Tax=Streptomyces haneummycinicus TaxID=3074435 RepID=A0AAT9HU17_9ACTN
MAGLSGRRHQGGRAAPCRVPDAPHAGACRGAGLALPKLLETDYVNTIPTSAEPAVDGDEALEQRITAWNRWNAAAMVTRGSKYGVGGHIATFASAAWLYETGFNHFFRGKEGDGSGDQLYIQGHASPASTPAPSSTAVSARSSSTTSAVRRAATACRRTRTRGGCRGCGSSRPCRWASGRSPRSTRRGSTAI